MIYVTGDIHANLDQKRLDFFKSLKKDDIMIVLGDFGFSWNKSLQNSWNALDIACLTVSVVGNHENYDLIKSCAVERVFGVAAYKLNPRTFYLMNGEIYNIEGIKSFVFGGADSIDKASRIPYVSWWPEEIPSRGEFLKGLSNLERNDWDIDLFLAHTCPVEVNTSLFNYPYKLKDPTEDMLSQYEYEIQKNNPKKEYPFLFGHHHNFKRGDKYICLYSQVMSIQKKEGKMVLDRVI